MKYIPVPAPGLPEVKHLRQLLQWAWCKALLKKHSVLALKCSTWSRKIFDCFADLKKIAMARLRAWVRSYMCCFLGCCYRCAMLWYNCCNATCSCVFAWKPVYIYKELPTQYTQCEKLQLFCSFFLSCVSYFNWKSNSLSKNFQHTGFTICQKSWPQGASFRCCQDFLW